MSADKLFISHASEDAATVDAIVAYLEARGVACWISSRDIPPRSIYAEAITDGVEACSACAVVVSAASNASDAVKRELELASHYKKPFIPIRIDDAEPGRGLSYYLRNAQWIDYRREGERALDRIARPAAEVSRLPTPKVETSHPRTVAPAPTIKLRSLTWPLLVISALSLAIFGAAELRSRHLARQAQFEDLPSAISMINRTSGQQFSGRNAELIVDHWVEFSSLEGTLRWTERSVVRRGDQSSREPNIAILRKSFEAQFGHLSPTVTMLPTRLNPEALAPYLVEIQCEAPFCIEVTTETRRGNVDATAPNLGHQSTHTERVSRYLWLFEDYDAANAAATSLATIIRARRNAN